MRSNPHPDRALGRRQLLRAGSAAVAGGGLALTSLAAWAQQGSDAAELLRRGGVVVAFRHARAPGTFDPPGFRLGDCSTQRNLSDEGRAQARNIGQWFKARELQPHKVLSSPWCRCIDTATLAFSPPQIVSALGSPFGKPETTSASDQQTLRAALAAAAQRSGQFEVWVTHMFVLSDLADANTQSGEGLVLRAGRNGSAEVLTRWQLPA